jgi:hypothetical protein
MPGGLGHIVLRCFGTKWYSDVVIYEMYDSKNGTLYVNGSILARNIALVNVALIARAKR